MADDMPYDLNEITGLSSHFNSGFDLLKNAIEFLAKQQVDLRNRLGLVEKDVGGVLKGLGGLQDELDDLGKSLATPSISSPSKEPVAPKAPVVEEKKEVPPPKDNAGSKMGRRSPP